MKTFQTATVLASLILAGSAFAQTPATSTLAPKPASASRPAAASAVHATKGVVKSVDATTLVITKVAGKGPETSFVLSSTTQRQGAIAAGATVDVRYHADGKNKVATAVNVVDTKSGTKAKSAK
jgi:hypothetical protein